MTVAAAVAYFLRIGPGGIIAAVLFIPLFILLMLFLPVLIIVILFMAAAVGVSSVLLSKSRKEGKQKERKRHEGRIIDAEYRIK
ncbi:hypothetical protein J4470_01400 [Candidatus Woesearchaeota archaeon]|nr:hypothetical protein [Candidatus Woesearchaeota archaeon]